ncbi:MAG: hypothetical protein HOJ35_12610 [Bdellovibrionales bacterium]|nr:hypothetical protein [Bdellovibrionales bacterium]
MRKQSATQSWEESYKLGQKSLKNKNLKDAYKSGTECLNIIKYAFNKSTTKHQLNLLDNYFKSILLLKSCSQERNCLGCQEEQYLCAINSLVYLNNSKAHHAWVRVKAAEIALTFKEKLNNFYNKNNMNYKRTLLNRKLTKQLNHLVIV